MLREITLRRIVEIITQFIEIAGVTVIALGIVLASAMVVWGFFKSHPYKDIYHAYRSRLGRAILLGLELLVAGDIILTVAIDPTLESTVVLGLIVLIRTFLSFTLEVEIQGYWPWRKAEMTREEKAKS